MKKSIEFKLAASRTDRKSLLKLLDKGTHIYNLALCRCKKLLNGIRADREYAELLAMRKKLKKEGKSPAEVDSQLQRINLPKVFGTVMLLFLLSFFVYLIATTKKSRGT